MKKSKKVTIVKKIVAFIIVSLMVLNSNPYQISEVNAAIQETINIKASEINSYINSSSRPDFINSIQSTNNGINLTLFDYNGRPFNLVMDQELKFNELTVTSSSISISGSSKLTVNKQILISSNFTIEKNANVAFNSDSTLTVRGSAYCEGNIQLNDAFKLSSNNDFCLRGGSITGSAQSYVFNSMYGNISIEGGIVDVTCTKDCFEAAKNISVSGGEMSVSSTKGSPFYAHYDFNFSGGTINASTNSSDYLKGTVVAGGNIVIADDCVIKKPSGCQIGKYNCGLNTIADSSGTKAKSVTIKGGAINLSNATVNGITDKDWTGSPITQNITVIYKDAVLVENYHYTLRYENNTDAGTAKVYIEPINANDVNGSKTCTFTIKEHVHTVVTDARKEATCTETGLTEGSHCSVCKKVLVAQEIIPKKNHDYQEVSGSAIKETCTKAGKKADKKCTKCGAIITGETIPASGHSYQYDYSSAVAPTCTANGKEADKVCTKCNDRITGATIKAKGHTEKILPAVEATTTSTGLTEGKICSTCGTILVKQEVIPMKDNTCQHVWNNGVVTTEPKCLEAGVKTYTCTKCGGTKTEPINALGHHEVIDAYLAPTTTSTGLTEGCHCDRCNQVLVKQNIIPMLEKDPDPEPTPEQGGGTNPDVQPGDNNQNDQNKQNNQTNTQQNSSNNQSNNKQNNNTNNNANNNTTTKKPAVTTPKYSNEWVDGKWYDESGNCTYDGILSWKSNASGWWVEDSAGWYPTDSWQKIDGAWYYFKPDGYMASEEYYKGYWFNSDGTMDDKYYLTWKSNASGWWVEDVSGWWPSNSWLKIDGYWYYFDGSGYMVTNQYVGGYWIGSDGICY